MVVPRMRNMRERPIVRTIKPAKGSRQQHFTRRIRSFAVIAFQRSRPVVIPWLQLDQSCRSEFANQSAYIPFQLFATDIELIHQCN